MEKRYFRADGSVIWILLSVSLARDADGEPLYFISQLQDIDARKRAHGELERLAHHDALTGALNRRAWSIELGHAIEHAERTGEPFAVAVIDLDDFKQVNDTHGHAAGDHVLQRAVGAWRTQLRDSDRLARLGGDEFAVLFAGSAAVHVDAIVARLKHGAPHDAGCSVGVAGWVGGDDAAALMRRADEALYADKACNRGDLD
jgi:diguanylate cyclase (GGDEF)-like protein